MWFNSIGAMILKENSYLQFALKHSSFISSSNYFLKFIANPSSKDLNVPHKVDLSGTTFRALPALNIGKVVLNTCPSSFNTSISSKYFK